ncbi:MAG: hypothetical protein WCR55_00290 [Lentisphaerota bacterium]
MKFKILAIFVSLFSGLLCFSSATTPEQDIAALNTQTEVINQAKAIDADELLSQGNKAYLDRNYAQAKDSYLQAISIISKSPGSSTSDAQKKISNITQSLSNVYTAWSQELLNEAKENSDPAQIEKSIELCKEAKEMNPQCSELADRLIAYYSENKKVMDYQQSSSTVKLLPDNKEKLYSVDVLYEQGKTLFNKKMYNQAKDKFQELLLIDPYNTNAIEYIKQINIKITAAGDYKTQVTATERAAEIEWEKLSPIMSRTLSGERVDLIESDTSGRKDSVSAIQEKLNSIVIKNISFEGVPIDTAIAFLKSESQKEDPTGKGVNFFLRLESLTPPAPAVANAAPQGAQPTQREANAEGWNEGSANKEEPNIANQYQVTLVVENVSLGKAIYYICKASGLNYKINKYAVEIHSPNVQESNLDTEVLPVEKEVFLDMLPDNKEADMKQYFIERGVQFPEGTTCVYDPKISRLIIRNTPAEINNVKTVLDALEDTLPQVSIAAKFVEMRQKDFEELGFDWQFSRSDSNNPSWKKSNGGVPNNTIDRFADDTKGNPIGEKIPDKEFGFLYSSNGIDLGGTMHALNQNEKAEILSAPRVTTLSGQKATIRLTTDRFFPTSWTAPTITQTQVQSVTSQSSTVTTTIPATPTVSATTPTPLGIRLDVTPQVSSDNYTIDMVLEPQVLDLVGWTEYSYASSGGADTQVITDQPIKMPEISARVVQTQVRTYDNETVVLGGVYQDTTQSINDNVPILSDIPLVGRLFQSQIDAPDKTNLLIFTTVQLIRPDGTPLRPSRNAGLPTFRD